MRASRQNSLPIRLLSLTLFVVAASSGPLVRPASGQDQPAPAPSEGADAKAAAENEPKQEKNEPLSGHSYHGEAFNEGPRQAAVLLPGMGAIKFPSAAQDETVRGFVNQGVAALHGFWYLESERSFRQAAKLQPDLAIAYWGMAMANANNQKRAREFIAEATERRDKASRHEQMYIDALAKFLAKPEKDENADQKKARQKKYIEDLEAIINEFPDDIDARALLVLQLWHSRGDIPITSNRAVDALMSEIFAVDPLHPAHHYRIHLWDGVLPKNAIESSAKCGPALPGIAHMWHMPGHIYSKLRRYQDAIWQQEASARSDHAHMIRTRLMPDQIHNFAHNNEWLVRNLRFLGHVNEAIGQSRDLIAMPMHPKYNSVSKRGSYSLGRDRLIETLTEYELWDKLAEELQAPYLAPPNDEGLKGEHQQWTAVAAYMTGKKEAGRVAHRVLNRQRLKLETEILDLEEGLDAVAEDKRKEDERTKTLEKARRDLSELNEKIAVCDTAAAVIAKDAAATKSAIERAKSIEKVLAASWLGQAGDQDAAIEQLRKLVEQGENEVRPLAVLIDRLWQAGKQDEAVEKFASLRKVAGTADFDTPLLKRLQPVADKAGVSGDWRIAPTPATDLGDRPSLDSIGPRYWGSYVAPSWKAQSIADEPVTDDAYQGKPKVLVFYLGFGCLHCVEQLKAFKPKVEEFAKQGIEVVAISTEAIADLKKGIEAYGEAVPMTILANPERDVFKAFRCWDDFEDQPLHGTFLIDADGKVRWQDIGHEPFNEVDFLLEESSRLLSLPSQR